MASEKMQRILEYRFSAKYMRTNSRDNPIKVIPSKFVMPYGDEKIVLCYHSLIIEGPKSLVCRYTNKHSDRNGLPKLLVVKYQLKFQTFQWNSRLKSSIVKRYLDPEKGDVLCSTALPRSDRLCPYYGTYLLLADPRVESPDRWAAYISEPNIPDVSEKQTVEAFVIQVFHEVKGCDMYSYLCEDGPSEIVANGARDSMETCLQLMADIFEGLNLMHRAKIYHGDLKPENVMLYPSARDGVKQVNGSEIRATIIDFDFAAKTSDDRIKRGTPRYLSPEYLQAYRGHIDLASLGKYGREFDVWAIGAIMWTLFYGGRRGEKLYFTSYSTEHLKNPAMTSKVIQAMMSQREYEKYLLKRVGKKTTGGKDMIRQLIIDLLAYDPRARPTAAQALRRIEEIQTAFLDRVPSPPVHQASLTLDEYPNAYCGIRNDTKRLDLA